MEKNYDNDGKHTYINLIFNVIDTIKRIANFWESIVEINSWNQKRILEIIVKKLFGNVINKKLVTLGLASKANTNDIRESAAITIWKNLISEGANIVIHDPKITSSKIDNDLQITPSSFQRMEILP